MLMRLCLVSMMTFVIALPLMAQDPGGRGAQRGDRGGGNAPGGQRGGAGAPGGAAPAMTLAIPGFPDGAQIPISELADVTVRTGAPMIKNEEGFLAGFVYVDTTGVDLGGYVTAKNGEVLAFSLIYNGSDRWNAKTAMDQIGATMAEFVRE